MLNLLTEDILMERFLMETSGEYVISSVLSHHSKNWKWWMDQCYSSVLQLNCIWNTKENTSLRHERRLTQKKRREERETEGLNFWLFFLCIFSPHPELTLCKLGAHLRFPSGPWTFLCSIFMGFSFLCLLATAILDSFFLL